MEKLIFDDGCKEFEINGDPNRVLRFNPADIGFIERLEGALQNVTKDMESLKGIKLSPTGNALDEASEAAELVRSMNKSLRASFDQIFYPGAADVVFGAMNPLALSGGHTIYENFLKAFVAIVKPTMDTEVKATQEHLEKYKSEYDRLPAGSAQN